MRIVGVKWKAVVILFSLALQFVVVIVIESSTNNNSHSVHRTIWIRFPWYYTALQRATIYHNRRCWVFDANGLLCRPCFQAANLSNLFLKNYKWSSWIINVTQTKHFSWWNNDMFRIGRWLFWSWFGVNRTILTKVSAKRRILHFRSPWPSR